MTRHVGQSAPRRLTFKPVKGQLKFFTPKI
jgi:hypothetical protein